MDDLQSQIDELVSRLDENDNSQQEFSDTLDSSLSDMQSTLDEQSTSIDELNQTSGQLTFPLSQDTIDLITEVIQNNILSGQVTLSGGVGHVIDNRIKATSIINISLANSSSPAVEIACGCVQGQANIASYSGSYSRTVNYIITI